MPDKSDILRSFEKLRTNVEIGPDVRVYSQEEYDSLYDEEGKLRDLDYPS